DLPETDHDVPARPGRMRERMAARLRRAQPAQAAPAPHRALTVQRPIPDTQDFKITKPAGSHPVSAFQDFQPALPTALCDSLEYTFLFGTGNARTCRIEFVILAVTPIAGHGGKGDRREPRPGRSGCHRGPGSTVRSSPRAPLRMTGTSAAASRACSA